MVHRKSIPVQSLLYFNNFLEFSYYYSGYNFKSIYFYNQILVFFLNKLFVKIFGFSINQMRIDYFKTNLYIFIDFKNVAYFMKSGKVYKIKQPNFKFVRGLFLMKFNKKSSNFDKWLDIFVYKMYKFYKNSCFLTYKKVINCILMYNRNTSRVHAEYFVKTPKKVVMSGGIVFAVIKCFFIYIYTYSYPWLNEFLYWFYSFVIYIFSLFFRVPIVFSQKNLTINWKEDADIIFKQNIQLVQKNEDILNLLDFLYIYEVYYIDILENSEFFLIYLKRFFIFLFYNFIFLNNMWLFCFYCFNYFRFLRICWVGVEFFYYMLIRQQNIININPLFCDFLFNANFKKSFKCYNSLNSYPGICFTKNSLQQYYFEIKRDIVVFDSSFIFLRKFAFFKNDFIDIIFNFEEIYSCFDFSVNKLFPISSRIVFKLRSLWYRSGFANVKRLAISSIDNRFNHDMFDAFTNLRVFFGFILDREYFYKFKLRVNSGNLINRNYKFLYRKIRKECLYGRGYNVGMNFVRFFTKNTRVLYLYQQHSYSSIKYPMKSRIYFMLIFVYHFEFIYQLLLGYNFQNLFFFFFSFLLKNLSCINKTFYMLFAPNVKHTSKLSTEFCGCNLIVYFNVNRFLKYFYKRFGNNIRNMVVNFSRKSIRFLYAFAKIGFFRQPWSNLSKFSLFERLNSRKVCNPALKCFYLNVKRFDSNILGFSRHKMNSKLVLKLINFVFNFKNIKIFSIPSVLSFNFGEFLNKLLNSILFNKYSLSVLNVDEICYTSVLLLSKWNFQISCNFSKLYVYSYLLDFNLKFLKGLCLLFCYYHFKVDFFFKFYFNLYFVNFVYFCEFFHYIFKMRLLLNFLFLKSSLTAYYFCGFFGLYLLIFKLSANFINITGGYILNYLYDIFYYLFFTNRYRRVKQILHILSNLFIDFLELQKFCGFNFKIKGRLSKKTQRKRCFVINRGFLKLTENTGNLFSGKRTLNTHIGSVSIYLLINLKVA